MSAQRAEYRVVFDRRAKREPDVLAPRVDFKLDDTSMERFLGLSLEPMSRDLARVGMAIFVADRLARRRNRQRQREVALQVAVSEPDFWGAADTRRLIETSAEFLGDDCWTLSFSKDESRNESDGLLGFRESPPAICLYSGGLDSAAGLATRLRSATGPVMAITAWHQAMQRRMVREEQIGKLRACYGADVQSLIVKNAPAAHPLAAAGAFTTVPVDALHVPRRGGRLFDGRARRRGLRKRRRSDQRAADDRHARWSAKHERLPPLFPAVGE